MSTSTLGGHVNTISGQATGGRRRRRLHSDEFKADAVAAAVQPGVSMAAVALSRGINANLLRRWVQEAEARATPNCAGGQGHPRRTAPKPCPTIPGSVFVDSRNRQTEVREEVPSDMTGPVRWRKPP